LATVVILGKLQEKDVRVLNVTTKDLSKFLESITLANEETQQIKARILTKYLNIDTVIINENILGIPSIEQIIMEKVVPMHLQTMHGFIPEAVKLPLPITDCFIYAIHKFGLDIGELSDLIASSPDNGARAFLHYYLQFLEVKGFKEAALPMQENDIILYSKKGKMTHAALVTKVTAEQVLVHAKFGQTPCAFQHPHDMTFLYYGSAFQIYRKANQVATHFFK